MTHGQSGIDRPFVLGPSAEVPVGTDRRIVDVRMQAAVDTRRKAQCGTLLVATFASATVLLDFFGELLGVLIEATNSIIDASDVPNGGV